MMVTPYIRDCIIHPEKLRRYARQLRKELPNIYVTFDQSLFDLYSRGLINIRRALTGATNADEFRLRVSGVRSV